MKITAYRNLNPNTNDAESITLFPCGDRVVTHVVFDYYDTEAKVRTDIHVSWQNACQYFRATRRSVSAVVFDGNFGKSFAQWKSYSAKGDGVETSWGVYVGGGSCVLRADIQK